MAVYQLRISEELKKKFDLLSSGFETKAKFLEKLLSLYEEVEYQQKGGTLLNEHIIQAINASVKLAESRLGNRLSKLIYEDAINTGIVLNILSRDKLFTENEIKEIRSDQSELMRIKNSVLNYNELKE